jgi:hypothetical protein
LLFPHQGNNFKRIFRLIQKEKTPKIKAVKQAVVQALSGNREIKNTKKRPVKAIKCSSGALFLVCSRPCENRSESSDIAESAFKKYTY